MKFTKENLRKIKEAAEVFVSCVQPEKDEKISREVAFVSGFMTAVRFFDVDITEVMHKEDASEH